jgi:hypothetical protein
MLASDENITQLEKAGFLTLPAPSVLELARLTRQVARNNHLDGPDEYARAAELLEFLREHIHHVIYIVKENRSYDQVLGVLETGNGDPRLVLFGEAIAPNHHAIARGFVTLDNFLVSGEGSWTGWDWSTAARTNDFREHHEALSSWTQRGFPNDFWGTNRNINVSLPTSRERHAEFSPSPLGPTSSRARAT